MRTKATIPAPLRAMLLILATAALCACDRPMSYNQASQTEPYRSLAESDRRWLYDHHQTADGALTWVEDELRMFDESYTGFWRTSEGTVELEDGRTKKTFSIKRDKLVTMVRKLGGATAALELSRRSRAKIGDYPRMPDKPYILIGLNPDTRRAQKLRYPKLFEECAVAFTQQFVNKALQLKQAGNARGALEGLAEAIEQRKAMLGDSHPATKGALSMYQAIAGKPYTGSSVK